MSEYRALSLKMRLKTPTISLAQFKKIGVSEIVCVEFEQRFGKKVEITEENVLKHYSFFTGYLTAILGLNGEILYNEYFSKEEYPTGTGAMFEHERTKEIVALRVRILTDFLSVRFGK